MRFYLNKNAIRLVIYRFEVKLKATEFLFRPNVSLYMYKEPLKSPQQKYENILLNQQKRFCKNDTFCVNPLGTPYIKNT